MAGKATTPGSAVAETTTVKVNGQSVNVPRTMPDPLSGKPIPTTMIQACEAAGVDVPHYCYHPKLPVSGNCRMCLVEFGTPRLGPDRKPLLDPGGQPTIAKSPRPAIACATPISPGMEIYTDTDGVRQMRQGVLEFLLANHPLDCPICDQAGECKLQQYALDHGHYSSRFVEEKVHKPKQVDLGPRIMLDDERCILCSRCIRFTRDIVGDDALGLIDRGSHTTLTAYPGRPFDNDYTLNTVDLCPVGALTSKDFRFRMRVWFLKETQSICPSCGTGCNILIGSRDEKIYRFAPRQNDEVNSCWMCDSGRLNFKWVARPDRLDRVMVQQERGQRLEGTWASVLPELGARLRAVAPGAAAVIASARQTNEELYLLRRLAERWGGLTDSIPRLGSGDKLLVSADKNPNGQGAKLLGVCPAEMGANLPKIAEGIRTGRIRTLLVFGEDVTRHGLGAELLAGLELLVVSDVLPNGTTELAHYLLPGCAPAEKRGTFTSVKGRVQRLWKAVEPWGEARAEAEFLQELWGEITGDRTRLGAEALFNRMAGEVPAFQELDWASLGDLGAWCRLE